MHCSSLSRAEERGIYGISLCYTRDRHQCKANKAGAKDIFDLLRAAYNTGSKVFNQYETTVHKHSTYS